MISFLIFGDFDIVNLRTKEINVNLAGKPGQTKLLIARVYSKSGGTEVAHVLGVLLSTFLWVYNVNSGFS